MSRSLLTLLLWLYCLCSLAQVQERGTELLDGDAGEISRIRAVLVGVSAYANLSPQAQLKYAHRDAEKMLEYLAALEGYEKDITLFLDEDATYPEVRKKLYEYLFIGTMPGDLVIFYFAGHGDVDMNVDGGYLLMHEAGSTDYAIGDAFPVSEIQRFMDSAAERHQIKSLLITDACRAGVALQGPLLGAGKTLSALLNNWSYTVKLVSCQPNQYSYELDKFGHGIFTYFLIEGLKGKADRNKDQKVTVSELHRYVTDQIELELADKQMPGVAGNTTMPLVSLAQPQLKMVQTLSPLASARSNPKKNRHLRATRPVMQDVAVVHETPDGDMESDDPLPVVENMMVISLSEEAIGAYAVKFFLENGWLTPLNQPAASDSLMAEVANLVHPFSPPNQPHVVALLEALEAQSPDLTNLEALKYEVAMALEQAAKPTFSKLTNPFQLDRQELARAYEYVTFSGKLLEGNTVLTGNTASQQLLLQAYLHFAQGEVYLAVQVFDSLLALGQGGAIAHYGRGLAYDVAGDYSLALASLEEARNMAHYWLAPTEMMADIYLREGEFVAAFEAYERFLEKNPGDMRAMAGLDVARTLGTPAMMTSVRVMPEHEKLFLLEKAMYALRGNVTPVSTDSLQRLYFTQQAQVSVHMPEGKKQTFAAKDFLKWWLEKNPDLLAEHATIFMPVEALPFTSDYKKVKGEIAKLEANDQGMFMQKKVQSNLKSLGVSAFNYGEPLPFRFHTLTFQLR